MGNKTTARKMFDAIVEQFDAMINAQENELMNLDDLVHYDLEKYGVEHPFTKSNNERRREASEKLVMLKTLKNRVYSVSAWTLMEEENEK